VAAASELCYPVSTRINQLADDDEECSRPVDLGALAHLGVARANALQSRTSQGADADAARVRALAAYKDFLTLWKDADPDIPILKEAKAEYAKLQ